MVMDPRQQIDSMSAPNRPAASPRDVDQRRSAGWVAILLAGVVALVLAACGGSGVGSNGTGESKQGSGTGTVTGFGSVYIDGVAYEDSAAEVLVEGSDGSTTLTETKIGQRVEVTYEPTGTGRDLAKVIRVDASLIGPVGAVGASTLTVLGQTVQINTDAALGPVTVFDETSKDLSAVKVGDAVEVHAIRKVVGGVTQLQATRVEVLTAAPTQLRVSGTLTGLSASGFTLGGLHVRLGSATLLQPAGSSLAESQWVLVYADATSFNPASMQLDAVRIRVGERSSPAAVADDATVSGYASELSSVTGGGQRLRVDGVWVVTDASTVFDPVGSAVALGAYLRVEGTYGADGVLHASLVHVHSADDNTVVNGTVVQLNTTTMVTFRVRDTWVHVHTPSGLDLQPCAATKLADGLYVTAVGEMVAGVLEADSIKCQPEPSGSVVERDGTIQSVNLGSRSLRMAVDGSGTVVEVRWSDTTYFRGLKPDALAKGSSLYVEGKLTAGSNGGPAVLIATKIKKYD